MTARNMVYNIVKKQQRWKDIIKKVVRFDNLPEIKCYYIVHHIVSYGIIVIAILFDCMVRILPKEVSQCCITMLL